MPFDIDARIDEWKRSLLDTTKRNRLIKFASGRGSGIVQPHPRRRQQPARGHRGDKTGCERGGGRLAATISPVAFAPEAGPVVRDVLHLGSSFWRWLIPRWGALRRQVTGWYAGPIPSRAVLLADLEILNEYHRRSDYARQVERKYAADLAKAPSGRIEWKTTAVGLKAIERYEKWKLPAQLRAAMAPAGGLDRAALARAAEDLKRTDIEFEEVWKGLLADYAPAGPDELNRTALSCP